MFDDEELVGIFKAESEERLQALEQGLLRLEEDPRDSPTVDGLFREAHNLKGAARMLGAMEVGNVAHCFEDVLGEARAGRWIFTPERIDGLYVGLDAMRKLVREALEGVPAEVNIPEVLEALSGSRAPAKPHSAQAAPEPEVAPAEPPPADPEPTEAVALPELTAELPQTELAPVTPTRHPDTEVVRAPAGEVTTESVPPSAPGLKIETIRVEPQKLDVLMTHAGELTVTKGRIARRLAEIDELVALQEEWLREIPMARDHSALPPSGRRPNSERERVEALGVRLSRLHAAAAEDVARLDFVSEHLEEGIRTIRLLPLSTIFNLFPRMVRDLARDQGKEVRFNIEGGDITADKRLIEEIKDPLMHMLRNAIDHGIELPEDRELRGKPRTAELRLRASQTATNILIEIEDDGRGIDLEAVRSTALRRRIRTEDELAVMGPSEIRELIFAPGFSTRTMVTDVSGRGVGLDVVRTKTDLLKGTLTVESEAGRGCRIRLFLPLTLASSQVLIASVGRQTFAFPLEYVISARLIAPKDVFPVKGCDAVLVDGQPLTVISLVDLLALPTPEPAPGPDRSPAAARERSSPCVILGAGKDRIGVMVDRLIDEQEIVVKPFGALLKRVPNVTGATILGDGEVCIVLNAGDMLKCARKRLARTSATPRDALPRTPVILLVEDSLTTRTQEKRILEGAGYEVVIAVDGVDGMNKLGTREFDAVISDVEMPNMDGLTFTTRIRQDARYRELPIILVTSLGSDESRRKGAEAGANAYLAKSSFNQAVLLETLRRLL
jgi:two-component system chemotaxis sensor kinase CheA